MAEVTILIPAAGKSSRMGGTDKLLETVRSQPLLRDRAEAALSACPRVLIALPPQATARRAVLHDLPVAVIEVDDAATGMSASLRSGAQAAGTADGLLIMLADMPDITAKDLSALIAAFDATDGQAIVRASAADGRSGHPVVFPRACLDSFARLTGDGGARAILAANRDRIVTLALEDDRALVDLDTPEAWAFWRAKHGAS